MIHLPYIPQRKSIHIILLLLLMLPAAGFGQREKMSALVRKAWLENAMMRAKGEKATAREKSITAFVKASSRQAVEGCKVLAAFPHGLYIASIPLNKLGEVAARQVMDIFSHTAAPVPTSSSATASVAHDSLCNPLPYSGLREKDILHGYGAIDAYAGLSLKTILRASSTSLPTTHEATADSHLPTAVSPTFTAAVSSLLYRDGCIS